MCPTALMNWSSWFTSTSMDKDESSKGDAKIRVPSQLTKNVASIHSSYDEDEQFRPHLGSKDPHNRSVIRNIVDEIHLQKENTYSRVMIERAVMSHFKSRQHVWREMSHPEQAERVALQSKQRRKRSRQTRLFKRRDKVVNSREERARFNELSLDFMSEESSCDEDFTVHPPAWRSNILTRFLHELDERVKEMSADVKQKRKIPDRKTRILGAPLSSFPPDRPPKWTISKDWIKDHPGICFKDNETKE